MNPISFPVAANVSSAICRISVYLLYPVLCAWCAAAAAQGWYYTEGPLRGSLKTTDPLPLYAPEAHHLWNRLFAVFYIRPSELPSRPDGPSDPSQLTEFDRKQRTGELRPGPVVKRIEGGDTMNLLAWPKTRYFSEPATFARANQLLDQFLETHGERLITDPLKRAFLQRDLWSVFDHLVNQNIDRFGDLDLARRRAAVSNYEIGPDELKTDDTAGIQRREILCRKLALVIKRLALPSSSIDRLPDNYAAAIRSGRFSDNDQLDARRNYLPSGLLTEPNEWVEIDTSPEPLHTDKKEGQIDYVAYSIRGRSYYRIFWRFPGGRAAIESYLKYLQEEGVDWKKTAQQGWIALKPDVRQIPVGTETAVVEFLVVLDDQLRPAPTRVVESVRVSVYKNVDGTPDPETNTGRGLISRIYAGRRRLLFDGLAQGGIERLPDDAPTYTVLINGIQDWGISARQQTVVQSCLHCHMYDTDRVGVFSLNTIFCFAPHIGMPGIVMPMGAGAIRTPARGERAARWKLGQEDYLRLVEYAREDRSSK